MTNLLDGALIGVQEPHAANVPVAATRADAEDCAFLASEYGLSPDPWQRTVLDGWMGLTETGRWSSPRCGLAVPRQCGKNAALEMRELYGMVALGERFLHTAHEVKTAQKAFRRLLYFFDNPRMFPKLHARTTLVRKANGQEAIVLDNGGSFDLVARSRGSGRGFSVDVLVCDEAQELSEDQLAALLPTISASANPQTLFTGTPPGPNAEGEIFTRTRTAGLEGTDPRLCWFEWSVDGAIDLDDVAMWAAANPALGIRLDVDTIADERVLMDDATFMRERLGAWDSAGVHRVISLQDWLACADPTLVGDRDELALAVDVSPDRRSTSICAAGWTKGPARLPFIDLIESRSGEPEWAITAIADLCSRHNIRAVAIDGISAASSLIDPLRREGVAITTTNATRMGQACAQFYDAVLGGRLRHLGQVTLDVALSAARRRKLGDGAWAWSRATSGDDISSVVAASLSLWALRSSEIAPRPRIRTGRATFV